MSRPASPIPPKLNALAVIQKWLCSTRTRLAPDLSNQQPLWYSAWPALEKNIIKFKQALLSDTYPPWSGYPPSPLSNIPYPCHAAAGGGLAASQGDRPALQLVNRHSYSATYTSGFGMAQLPISGFKQAHNLPVQPCLSISSSVNAQRSCCGSTGLKPDR